MAEMVISDGAVYVKGGRVTAPPGVNPDGYINLSDFGLTLRITTRRETAEIRRHGTNNLSEHLPAGESGQISISFVRDDAAAVNPHDTIRAIETAARPNRGVFVFIIIIDSSEGAPKYSGMATITDVDYWGPGDGSAAGIITVTANLSRFFDVA